MLDQRELPYKEIWLAAETIDDMIGHIKTLAVRGAPMIGCAAALVLAQHVCQHGGSDIARLAEYTKSARYI